MWFVAEKEKNLYSINFLFFLLSQNKKGRKSVDIYVLEEINT